MSTGSSETASGAAADSQGEPSAAAADSREASSSGALGLQAAAFVDEFERWAHRKAIEAGASVPRLRLLYSVHCNGPQKMADLADELTVTPRNVTALVDGLEADGLVRRVPHATDRRVTLVQLTCNSERVESQFRAYQSSLADLFSGLSEDDQRELARMLSTLHDRMGTGTAGSVVPRGAFDA
jgi:DNA-binding MarR family transcriptional regulator